MPGLVWLLVFGLVGSATAEVEDSELNANDVSENEVKENEVTEVVNRDGDIRYKFIHGGLVGAGDLKVTGPEYVHLAMIVANVGKGDLVVNIIKVLHDLLHTLFFSSRGHPVHLIFLTDEQSWREVEKTVVHSIGKYISESILYWEVETVQTLSMTFPRIQIEFVDINSIVDANRESIEAMKEIFSLPPDKKTFSKHNDTMVVVISPKYKEDLFYMAPFYPTAFKSLDRLLVFDVDLLLKEDLSVLSEYFDTMTGDECIALALDQLGYYKPWREYFIKNNLTERLSLKVNDTRVRGTNTGVVLYHLEKIRANKELMEQVKPESMKELAKSLNFKGVVGDQEWYTLLMWKYPQFFKILPCAYNVQKTPVEYYPYPCEEKVKILHSHSSIHDDRWSFANEFIRKL